MLSRSLLPPFLRITLLLRLLLLLLLLLRFLRLRRRLRLLYLSISLSLRSLEVTPSFEGFHIIPSPATRKPIDTTVQTMS